MPGEEAIWEELKTCERAVFDGGRPDYTSACGEPSTRRVSWDSGQNWLYLCYECSRQIEAAEEGLARQGKEDT